MDSRKVRALMNGRNRRLTTKDNVDILTDLSRPERRTGPVLLRGTSSSEDWWLGWSVGRPFDVGKGSATGCSIAGESKGCRGPGDGGESVAVKSKGRK